MFWGLLLSRQGIKASHSWVYSCSSLEGPYLHNLHPCDLMDKNVQENVYFPFEHELKWLHINILTWNTSSSLTEQGDVLKPSRYKGSPTPNNFPHTIKKADTLTQTQSCPQIIQEEKIGDIYCINCYFYLIQLQFGAIYFVFRVTADRISGFCHALEKKQVLVPTKGACLLLLMHLLMFSSFYSHFPFSCLSSSNIQYWLQSASWDQ